VCGEGGKPDLPRCSVCGDTAVLFQRHTGRHLCGEHLSADIEERVAATIRSEKMITPGDHVTIALSGGKDSTALLMILTRLLPAWDGVRLSVLTIDEGITGYREDTIRCAEQLVHRFRIAHLSLSFHELFAGTLDELLIGRETSACSICGILRRKALITGAQRAGATKLATGHNLDDEAQSVLMNVLRGDLPRLVRNSGLDSSGLFIPRIKPLMHISEKEIATYLVVNGMWEDLPECPYARYALRREVRTMLGTLEFRHPGTMLRLMQSKKSIETRCAGMTQEPIRHCRECNDPCSGEVCQLCQLKHSLGR
jgi:uncharacterized protein (TIGR00269 family)